MQSIRLTLTAMAALASLTAVADAPRLYRHSFFESPVRADPDDLLLLAGYGLAADDQVVYESISDDGEVPSAPRHLPAQATPESGSAAVVSTADVPYSLTVKLPPQLRGDRSYALWVRSPGGEWSQPVQINDARPLWLSPAYVYATEKLASLARELKIVGRNLRPAQAGSARIRLIGPGRYELSTVTDARSSPTMDRYVARASLPDTLIPGRYRVQFSTTGSNWTEIAGQSFEVRADPTPKSTFAVDDPRFGGCRPDDGLDDTDCILRAVAAARRADGGVVSFGPGVWDLMDSNRAGVVAAGGIVVPLGVELRGAGEDRTVVARHAQWNLLRPTAAFTLVGRTVVSGFRFKDLQIYAPRDGAGPFLQIGENFQRVAPDANSDPSAAMADDIAITQNIFDKTMIALGDGGLPLRRLFVVDNTFGAYKSALELGGNRFNMNQKYAIEDSVIAKNSFKPGSMLDVRGKTGTIAGEIGASRRLDFSDNIADGSSTEYLYSPADPRGWRAAFFWNLNGNVEQTLIAQNTVSCAGDKIGDGEAIALDNNANTFAFAGVSPVAAASAATVAVPAPLLNRQNDRDIPLSEYYVGHWVQIAGGPGLGQVRKITGYSTDVRTGLTAFSVAPDWDVIPIPGRTRIAVGREFWQVYVVDNRIDDRRPLCRKSNRSRRDGGAISLWAQSADSVIEGNRQYDTDGILVQQAYVLPERGCPNCAMESYFQSFLEIRGNIVDGKYDWTTNCSASGIVAGIAAAPWNDAEPPTVGFGVRISHNVITHADAPGGGAIALVNSWYAGPDPQRWPLSDAMLIDHNAIAQIEGPPATAGCGGAHPRVGIQFPDRQIAWHSVLYGNSCDHVSTPLGARGVDGFRLCPSNAAHDCECP